MGWVGWELQSVNFIMDLGSMLLCTTSDDKLFSFILMCSHDSNHSSLLMSNLISMRIKFMDMKRHVFNCFPYWCWWVGENNDVIINLNVVILEKEGDNY
jgi:hypothetical protein